MRITYVITGLNIGGAETMLCRLVKLLDRARFEPRVISLTDLGPKARELIDYRVPVLAAGMRSGRIPVSGLLKLGCELRRQRPAIVHTWMYHADLIGGIAAAMAGRIPTLWCVRNGTLDEATKLSTRAVVKACALLSRSLPRKIVLCSEDALRTHAAAGYDSGRMEVIPNGVDVSQFRSALDTGARIRSELQLPPTAIVIGHVARLDPQKDHRTFVEALAIACTRYPNAYVVMCGEGVVPDVGAVYEHIKRCGAPLDRIRLLGRRTDIQDVMCAFDLLAVSSSFGESFPNVIVEAMACSLPCVTTKVGGAADVVADTGLVVPARDPVALAGALMRLLEMPPKARALLGHRARLRVEAVYRIEAIVQQYEDLYLDVVNRRR